MKDHPKHIALAGNPNSGKTTLFNALTGLNQKVGNFPGVTVDKKTGKFTGNSGEQYTVTDLPGIYSLSPKSTDEEVTCRILFDKKDESRPEAVIIVLDSSNLKRNLFLATQIIDLKVPAIIAMNMSDVAEKEGIDIDTEELEKVLGLPVVAINAKTKKGIKALKDKLDSFTTSERGFFKPGSGFSRPLLSEFKSLFKTENDLTAFKLAVNAKRYRHIDHFHEKIENLLNEHKIDPKKEEILEISERYRSIGRLLPGVMSAVAPKSGPKAFTAALDKLAIHRVWGFLIFLGVFFLMFQAVFTLAEYPMNMIDDGFGMLSALIQNNLPDNVFTDFLANGIVAGIGGIVIFVPQIMILFGLIAILEDTGYMARVSFLNDRLLRAVGMNGKSVVPLVSGFACAIPAIMATRSIENWKERLITIMVTPLMSCAARLPVYVFLVGFIVPREYLFGFINLQGLFMLGLYLLGIVLGAVVAYVFHLVLKSPNPGSFILELPTYRAPRWRNAWSSMLNKGYTFVTEAGKIILSISIILWGLSSFGPSDEMAKVEEKYEQMAQAQKHEFTEDELKVMKASEKLQHSYAGKMGKFIEPAIRPLGFDWKIGIAVIASFAAREVFVGTMSIIYSVEGDAENIQGLREKMKTEIHPVSGKPLMSVPTAASLLIFFVIAMQCMSTLAVTKRETNSWKWPVLQFAYLTALAYFASLITYQSLI